MRWSLVRKKIWKLQLKFLHHMDHSMFASCFNDMRWDDWDAKMKSSWSMCSSHFDNTVYMQYACDAQALPMRSIFIKCNQFNPRILIPIYVVCRTPSHLATWCTNVDLSCSNKCAVIILEFIFDFMWKTHICDSTIDAVAQAGQRQTPNNFL